MIRAIGGRERFRHSHGPNPVLLKPLLLMGRALGAASGQLPVAAPGQLPVAAPRVRVMVLPGPGSVRLISGVASRQWVNLGMV